MTGAQPRWPMQQAVFGAGVIVLIFAAMGEVVLLPPGRFYERLVIFSVITGFLAARISSIRICVALAAAIGRGYRTLRIRESALDR